MDLHCISHSVRFLRLHIQVSTVYLLSFFLLDPECEAQNGRYCDLGIQREIALTVYGLVGYPLFAILLSQFAALIVNRTVREQEIRILHSPLTEREFNYAANLYGNDEVGDL